MTRISFVVVFLILLPNFAGAAQRCGSLDRVVAGLQLVRILYPALSGREMSFTFWDGPYIGPAGPMDGRSFGIQIDKPIWHPPASKSSLSSDVLATPYALNLEGLPLRITFNFINSRGNLQCRPVQFLKTGGPSKSMDESYRVINAHPEWTDMEAMAAAKQHGLRFEPRDKAAILKLIPMIELSKIYGSLRFEKAEFTTTSEHEKDARYQFADLSWHITMQEIGTTRWLQITIEPFNGQIISISEGDKRDIVSHKPAVSN